MKNIIGQICLLLAITLNVSCSDAKVDTSNNNSSSSSSSEYSELNEWIFDVFDYIYYWNDDYTDEFISNLNFDQDYTDFFKSLLHVPSETIDQSEAHDGVIYNGTYYMYSSIGRYASSKADTRAYGLDYNFGLSFNLYSFSNMVAFSINYVVPGSAADKAGITRDHWITKVNNVDLTVSNYQDYYPLLLSSSSVSTVTVQYCNIRSMIETNSKSITLTSDNTVEYPAMTKKIITPEADPSKKIGYLLYNSFSTNQEDDPSGTEFVTALTDSLQSLSSANVTDLIIDLRYNPGGYVSICQKFTSILAGKSNVGDTFCNMEYAGRSYTQKTSLLSQSFYFDLDNIYFLVSNNTASASELLINSLKGVDQQVTLVGTQTTGKNVGSDLFNADYGDNLKGGYFDGYQYYLSPISFKLSNAKGDSNYANGFTPDHTVEDFNIYNQRYDLGDENEKLLAYAIKLITGQTSKAATNISPSSEELNIKELGTSIDYRQRGGAIFIPEQTNE